LRAPIAELSSQEIPVAAGMGTLEDADRAYIKAILRETNWVVGGPNGAAARLGLRRTTLIARMRKLGISREIVARSTKLSEANTKTPPGTLSIPA
jgi:formate hydrogenlyase transcriptional activator